MSSYLVYFLSVLKNAAYLLRSRCVNENAPDLKPYEV